MGAALFSEEYSLPCFCVLVCLLVLLCGMLLLFIFPAVVPPSLPSSTPAKITVNSEAIDATREPCCSTLVRTIILQMPEMCTEQLSAQKAPKGKLVKAPKCSHVFRVAAHTLGLSQSTTLTTFRWHSEQSRLGVVTSECSNLESQCSCSRVYRQWTVGQMRVKPIAIRVQQRCTREQVKLLVSARKTEYTRQ